MWSSYLVIYSHSICLAAKNLDEIQIYTEMYKYKITIVLYKISSYEEHMAEKSFGSD